MIRFLFLQNRAGKTRLAKYYVPVADNEKRKLEYDVHRLIVTRDPKHTNFAEVSRELVLANFAAAENVLGRRVLLHKLLCHQSGQVSLLLCLYCWCAPLPVCFAAPSSRPTR